MLAVTPSFALSLPLILLLLLPFFTFAIPWVIMPQWELIFVYYWGIFAPRLLPIPGIIAFSLLHDSFHGTLLGMTALKLLIIREFIISYRQLLSKEPFSILCLIYSILVIISLLFETSLTFLFSEHFQIAWPHLMIQCVLSIFTYPLLHHIFSMIYALFPKGALYEK